MVFHPSNAVVFSPSAVFSCVFHIIFICSLVSAELTGVVSVPKRPQEIEEKRRPPSIDDTKKRVNRGPTF